MRDDGSGFAFAEAERGLGLAGMRERSLLVDGDLNIESRPGNGTTVRLRVAPDAEPLAGRLARCESSSPTTTGSCAPGSGCCSSASPTSR